MKKKKKVLLKKKKRVLISSIYKQFEYKTVLKQSLKLKLKKKSIIYGFFPTRKKIFFGIVSRDSLHKTTSVIVKRRFRHPKYLKEIVKFKRFLIHDEKNLCKTGNFVAFFVTRKISKLKNFLLYRIITI